VGNSSRSLEDLKHRFYDVTSKVITIRNKAGSGMSGQHSYAYDGFAYQQEQDEKRRSQLEAAFSRTKEDAAEEKKLLTELKRVDAALKKLKPTPLSSGGHIPALASHTHALALPAGKPELPTTVAKGAVLRSSLMMDGHDGYGKGSKTMTKITTLLADLGAAAPLPTQSVHEKWLEVRRRALVYLSLHKQVASKEASRSALLQRRKQIASQPLNVERPHLPVPGGYGGGGGAGGYGARAVAQKRKAAVPAPGHRGWGSKRAKH
jgi:hypothetical protein